MVANSPACSVRRFDMKYTILAVIGAALLLEGAAFGKDDVFQEPDKGLSDTLKRNGCHPGWLILTMRLSGLVENDLGRLQWGTPITLPDNCKAKPSRAVRHETRQVIARMQVMQAAVESENRITGLIVENATLRQNAGRAAVLAEKRINELTGANVKLIADNQELLARLDRAVATPTSRLPIALWSLAGIILPLVAWGGRERYLRTHYVMARKAVKHCHIDGESYVFHLARIDPKSGQAEYDCALDKLGRAHRVVVDSNSSGKKLRKAFGYHLTDTHCDLHVEITSEFVPA
jgi:hypothetical protein